MPEKYQDKEQRSDEVQGAGREDKQGKSPRGFAAMDPQRQRDIASEGGRAAHEQGKAHKFTPEEARQAGRKGGMASGAARASRSKTRAGVQNPKPGSTGTEDTVQPNEDNDIDTMEEAEASDEET